MKSAHEAIKFSERTNHPLLNGLRRVANWMLQPFGMGVRFRHDLVTLDKATRFAYYWYNAKKKQDIRNAKGFGPLAKKTLEQGRTYLNYDRLYTLWQAIEQLPDSAVTVAEVGAYKGGSAKFIAEALRWHNQDLPLYVFDTFEGHSTVDPTFDGKHQVGQQFRSTSVEGVSKYLRKYPNLRIIKGDFRDTAHTLEDTGVPGFVHIDVDVYRVTKFCLEYFGSRMVAGGIIIVDDYGFRTTKGVRQAVEEFIKQRTDYCRIHLLTGQALLLCLEDRDTTLSNS